MNEQQFDNYLNIQTTGFQYGFPKLAKYHRYEPTPYSGLEQLFEVYELPMNANFLDIGCGKGRVPIYVHHRFDIPVKGIEMDQKFFVEAEHNAAQYLKKAGKKRSTIQFLNIVAERYVIEKKDQVFFIFNPFDIILYYPSPDYLQYLQQELALESYLDLKLRHEKNENERIIIFRLHP